MKIKRERQKVASEFMRTIVQAYEEFDSIPPYYDLRCFANSAVEMANRSQNLIGEVNFESLLLEAQQYINVIRETDDEI